ncbi:MAG: 50S ribosomal protein L23 [Candidatus Coatesbacteria bacterium]|nr:MAG: 50S ribosomal protein L23 [Candidatus Coatesbacteria bacterium]
MKDPHDIVLKPLLTEKMEFLKDDSGKYAFAVQKGANKIEIKEAIESIYNVTVTKVAVMNQHAKKRRIGWIQGRRSSWKKAIVTLKEGDSIEYFE